MNSEADRFWDEIAGQLRKKKGFCPLSPEEAAAAFHAALPVPLPEDRIDSFVKAATSGDTQTEDPESEAAWSEAKQVAGRSPQLCHNQGEDASVTFWIDQLGEGNSLAYQKLWERYFHRLVGLARSKLRMMPRRGADEEDVALSAFDSFFRGVEQGRFPQLEDRDDLWQVLLMITQRKAIDLLQHEGREKRDWRRNQPAASESGSVDLAGREPDPAFAAQVAEECEKLLAKLEDSKLRQIAVLKMEGYTN
jgi:DNA-directed RNA polymerase specialized sigma24 family protein